MSVAHKMQLARIAEITCVSERTVRWYLHLFHTTGDVQPIKGYYGRQPLFGDYEQLTLLRLILENTGIFLHEIQEKLHEEFGVYGQHTNYLPNSTAYGVYKKGYPPCSFADIGHPKGTVHE